MFIRETLTWAVLRARDAAMPLVREAILRPIVEPNATSQPVPHAWWAGACMALVLGRGTLDPYAHRRLLSDADLDHYAVVLLDPEGNEICVS